MRFMHIPRTCGPPQARDVAAVIRVIPNGPTRAGSSRGLDLCTKTRWRGPLAMRLCYKSGSARKYLIFNEIPSREIFGRSSQALDFSGFGGYGRAAFNKVI